MPSLSVSVCLAGLELRFEAGFAHWHGNFLQAGSAAWLPVPCPAPMPSVHRDDMSWVDAWHPRMVWEVDKDPGEKRR